MFTLEDIKEFLKELNLKETEENIKWAYNTLLKETKVFIKMRKFELEFDEDLYDDCCCGDECDCDDKCDCDENCKCHSK